MGAGHDHGGAAARAGEKHRGRLWAAFALLAVFMVVEAVAAWATGSLALLSDAGHMFTDVLGIGMALAAITAARRAAADPQRTFGLYRLEVLAALANAVLLFGVAIYVLVEAVRRLAETAPEVKTTPMLIVAGAGLVANIVAFLLLRGGAEESINVRGAYLEVLGDLVNSVGVIVAAVVIAFTDWWWVDSVVAVAVGLFILPRTYKLGRAAVRILVQAAPEHVDVAEVERPADRGRRRTRCARPSRLDADLGHGGRVGAPRHRPEDRSRGGADRGAHGAARGLRHRPRDAAGRAARADEGLRPGRLVRG